MVVHGREQSISYYLSSVKKIYTASEVARTKDSTKMRIGRRTGYRPNGDPVEVIIYFHQI